MQNKDKGDGIKDSPLDMLLVILLEGASKEVVTPSSEKGILGPFTQGKGQVKFLIVGINYFTKWIEAKPLTTITTQQVQQFVWKDIICRYGMPHTIINTSPTP